MKKKILFFILFCFTCLLNVNAITSSGSANEKTPIYPLGDPYCNGSNNDNVYYRGAGVFLTDSKHTTIENNDPSKYIESKEVYEMSNLAKKACDNLALQDKEKGYLCKDTVERTAYACSGTIKHLEGTEKEYLEKYITGGQMFETESLCKENCDGTCNMQIGYAYRYVLDTGSEIDGDINIVGGSLYQTIDGSYAFCIQPAKAFQCPYYYTNTGELIPQYCLNSQFDLSTCKYNYEDDYRCGLAYIALKATTGGKTQEEAEQNGKLTKEQYAAADMAMRMWASHKGKLAGTQSTSLEMVGGKTTNINFFGITAKRVEEDINYLKDGLVCEKNSRYTGVLCTYQSYTAYKKALQLYNDALNANAVDEAGDRIPELVTKHLGSTNNSVQITNPTGETCEIGDKNCRVIIEMYDANGKLVPADSTYCDKNYCYAVYKGEKLCTDIPDEEIEIKIIIKNWEASGKVKEYRHCANPTERQIMYVVDALGKETITKDYEKKFTAGVACDCKDEVELKSEIDYEGKDKKYCDDYNKLNTEETDYNGVETGYIKDPSMANILHATCDRDKYFRVPEYEVGTEGVCKVYCRNEIKFYMANKEKVYAGMQFKYELEEKVENKLQTNQHLTAVVLQKKECVSEIDYDYWKEELERKNKVATDAWNNWKFWHVLSYRQNLEDDFPIEFVYAPGCTANCKGLNIAEGGKSGSSKPSLHCSGNNINLDKACEGLSRFGTSAMPTGTIQEAGETCRYYNKETAPIRSKNGVCAPECTERYRWDETPYLMIDWENGRNDIPGEAEAYTAASLGQSGYGCYATAKASVDYLGVEVFRNVSRENIGDYDSCDKINLNKYICQNEVEKHAFDSYRGNCNTPSCDAFCTEVSNFLIGRYNVFTGYKGNKNFNYSYSIYSDGSCINGTSGNIELVHENESAARRDYFEAQEAVQEWLTAIQRCNMFGSGVGDPDITYYTLTKGDGGPGGGGGGDGTGGSSGGNSSGGNSSGGIGGGGTHDKVLVEPGAYIIDESVTNYKYVNSDATDAYGNETEYNAQNMVVSPNTEYKVQKIATTNNSNSIKKQILRGSSCIDDDSCVDLTLGYQDTVYGEAFKYEKRMGIISTGDLLNVYCDDGENCFRKIEDGNFEYNEGNWGSNNAEGVYRLVCDATGEPYTQKCEKVMTYVPSNDYVSFKVTTEVDFYRQKEYVTEPFTGKVYDKNKVNSSKNEYIALDKNVYPTSNDKINGLTGSYEVNYTFTNLGISKFGVTDNKIDFDTYKYQCAYEVYNETNRYDCEPNKDNDCLEDSWYPTESKDYGFVFRNVDLYDLFPGEEAEYRASNWSVATSIIEDIQNKGNDIYTNEKDLVLSVTLTTDSIKKIRQYNKMKVTNSGGYLDNSLWYCDKVKTSDGKYRFGNCRSSFIDEIAQESGVLGVKFNSINRGGVRK